MIYHGIVQYSLITREDTNIWLIKQDQSDLSTEQIVRNPQSPTDLQSAERSPMTCPNHRIHTQNRCPNH